MSIETSKPVKPKRRWFQFSLRGMLIFTTIVAALFAWWSYKARQQREATRAIMMAGGTVIYDYFVQGLMKPRYWPEWLVDGLGLDYFANVQQVYLHQSPDTDADLKHLKGLTALKWLGLRQTQVTDPGLDNLKGLTGLTHLFLNKTQITDVGLEHLNGLTNLRVLDLSDTKVTGAGVERLQKALPHCKITH